MLKSKIFASPLLNINGKEGDSQVHPEYAKMVEKSKVQHPLVHHTCTDTCKEIVVPNKCAHRLSCCDKDFNLTRKLFKKYRNGIVLTQPGVYQVTEDIRFKPCSIGQTGITIQGQGITLDFGAHTFSQGNKAANTYLVAIARGSSNIRITGVAGQATLLDASLVGLRILGQTQDLIIENLIITQSEKRYLTDDFIPADAHQLLCATIKHGLLVGEGDTEYVSMKGTSSQNKVDRLTISNFRSSRVHAGGQLVFTNNVTMNNSFFTENTWIGFVLGSMWVIPSADPNDPFPMVNICQNIAIDNCHFDNNDFQLGENLNPLDNNGNTVFYSSLGYGYNNNACLNVTMTNSSANSNKSSHIATGIYHDGAINTIFKNLECSNNHGLEIVGQQFDGSNPTNYGFAFDKTYPFIRSENILLENCTYQDNYSTSFTNNLALIGVKGALIQSCFSTGAHVTATGFQSSGLFIAGNEINLPGQINTMITIKDCVIENIQRPYEDGPEQNNKNFGISVTGDVRDLVIDGCTLNGGFNQNFINDAYFVGILLTVSPPAFKAKLENILIKNNNIINAGFALPANIISGAGILNLSFNLSGLTIMGNTITNCVGSGITIVDTEAINHTITDNQFNNNTGYGLNLNYPPGSTEMAVVMRNTAIKNQLGNYNGVPDAWIATGTAQLPPPETCIRNISIE